jgi:AbrB family looped-hinge helix DNA binding protein
MRYVSSGGPNASEPFFPQTAHTNRNILHPKIDGVRETACAPAANQSSRNQRARCSPITMVYAISTGMTPKIDKAGRIVVPKPIRDRLGLRTGVDLEVTEGPDGILIRPAARGPRLVREGLLLVHTGELPPGYDLTRAVDEDREDRIREIWSR